MILHLQFVLCNYVNKNEKPTLFIECEQRANMKKKMIFLFKGFDVPV